MKNYSLPHLKINRAFCFFFSLFYKKNSVDNEYEFLLTLSLFTFSHNYPNNFTFAYISFFFFFLAKTFRTRDLFRDITNVNFI